MIGPTKRRFAECDLITFADSYVFGGTDKQFTFVIMLYIILVPVSDEIGNF